MRGRALASRGRDLVVTAPQLDAEDDQLAISGCKTAQSGFVPLHGLLPDGFFERRGRGRGQVRVQGPDRRLPCLAAVQIGEPVGEGPPKVGLQRPGAANLHVVEVADRGNHRLLDNVLGVEHSARPRRDPAGRPSPEPRQVGLDERVQGVSVAGLRSTQKARGGRGQIAGGHVGASYSADEGCYTPRVTSFGAGKDAFSKEPPVIDVPRSDDCFNPDPTRPGPQDVLVRQLPEVYGAVRWLARRQRLREDEERDLLSDLLLHLIADDYAVLRKFRGEGRMSGFLRRVAYRLLLDARNRRWGKWRPSRRARGLGPAAIKFERLVARDGFTVTEALQTMGAASLDREVADSLAADAGRRRRRGREVSLDQAASVPVEAAQPGIVEGGTRSGRAARVSAAMEAALARLSSEDCELLHGRFVQGESVVAQSRRMHADQKHLYRRHARILRRLRHDLMHADIGLEDVRSVIGHPDVELQVSAWEAAAGHS